MYAIIGALLYGYTVWNVVLYVVDRITKKDELSLFIISLVLCMALTLVIGFIWYPMAFVLHVPAVVVFFLYDLVKYKKAPSEKVQKGA